MAIILEKQTDLEKEVQSCQQQIDDQSRKALWVLVPCLPILAMGMLLQNPKLFIASVAVSFVLGILSLLLLSPISELRHEITILEAGIRGENLTRDLIKDLPDTYTGLQNVVVSYEGKRSEIDLLVVGPTGVFVVETKNLNGNICGSGSDHNWVQHKVGRAGTPYSKEFYNPVKQVGTHVYRIANHLKQCGIRTYVNAAVYFSNPESEVNVTDIDPKTPVFAQHEDKSLLHHILNGNQQLSPADCQKIVALLQS